jgi:hypothetical protein
MLATEMQVVVHSDSTGLELPAIVRDVFSLVIRPPWTVRRVAVYQIIHRRSGYHVASFTVTESAAGFFRDVDRHLPNFTNSQWQRFLVKRLLRKWQAHEERHEDYLREDISFEIAGFTKVHDLPR